MKRHAAVALLVGAGVALSGCGGGDGDSEGGNEGESESENGIADMESGQILTELQDAVAAAESVQLTGELSDGGQDLVIDMTYGPDSAAGTIASEGIEFEFLSVDGDVYMKASADTWDSFGGAGLGQLIGDLYVLVPSDDAALGEMTEIVDREAFVREIFSDVDAEGATKGEETEIDGRPALGLSSDDGSVLYIATTGDPLPIQIAAPEGETGSLDFEWDIDVDITAPDEADVADLSELQQ